ncbi:Rad2 nuclease [Tulasnella sp. JGI-2019a]|nr:Rad2 nuclease [Tulasnella sp. JGI-2019a]
MGIQGLLPLLKSIQVNTHLSEFKGKRFAVDAYVWLHRGAYACAPQLVKGESTTKYVDYIIHRIRMMRHHGVEPYLVFDGGPLPAKRGTETDRAKRREENLARANELTSQGLHSQARDLYVKCVDVTPAMAHQVIKALKLEHVSYVVAPYEADAQLAYLELNGMVDGIVTEDSDLLVFGCKNVLFKLDPDGNCVSIRRERLGSVSDAPMSGWGDKEFREMAILSGCDYLPSVVGLGIKTAHKYLRKYKTVEKVLQFIRLESNMKVPPGYLNALRQAELPFQHQRVYDPRTQRLVHMKPIGENVVWDEVKDAYVGMDIEPDIARGIAEGDIEPTTLEPIEDINPNYKPKPPTSSKLKFPLSERNSSATSGPSSQKGTLKNFFSVLPKSRPTILLDPRQMETSSAPKNKPLRATIGTNSGMKTLSEQMAAERERKAIQTPTYIVVDSDEVITTTSRFFTSNPPPAKRKREDQDVLSTPRNPRRTRPSATSKDMEKENKMPPPDSPLDPVMQEGGYISPVERGTSVVDVSSPSILVQGELERNKCSTPWQIVVGGGEDAPTRILDDDVSSPATGLTPKWQNVSYLHARAWETGRESPTKQRTTVDVSGDGAILVHSTPSPEKLVAAPSHPCGVDLRDGFKDETSSEGAVGPDTPYTNADYAEAHNEETNWDERVDFEVDVDLEVDEIDEGAGSDVQRIMLGWRKQWSHTTSLSAVGLSRRGSTSVPPPSIPTPPLVDDDDTFGPSPSLTAPLFTIPLRFTSQASSSSTSFKRRGPLAAQHLQPRQPRRSLPAKQDMQPLQTKKAGRASLGVLLASDEVEDIVEIMPASKRLQDFRYAPR